MGENKELDEFKNDFTELIRAYRGVNREYSKLGNDVDKYAGKLMEIISLFNKKYNNLIIELSQTTEELKLRIFFREKSVKDAFINAASRIEGLNAIGSEPGREAKIEEADKFSKELDNAKNRLFAYYSMKGGGSDIVFLEHYDGDMIELHYGRGIGNERSPRFRICSHYATKGGVKDINLSEDLCAVGFLETPSSGKIKNFFKKFEPRIEE